MDNEIYKYTGTAPFTWTGQYKTGRNINRIATMYSLALLLAFLYLSLKSAHSRLPVRLQIGKWLVNLEISSAAELDLSKPPKTNYCHRQRTMTKGKMKQRNLKRPQQSSNRPGKGWWSDGTQGKQKPSAQKVPGTCYGKLVSEHFLSGDGEIITIS